MFLIILQLFVSSFLLSTASVPTQVKVAVNEYYVTPTPAPNPYCPHDKPCHTLNEYARNSSSFFNNQTSIVLFFLNGRHKLTSCDLLISKIESINFTVAQSNFKPQAIIQMDWRISIVNVSVVNFHYLMIFSLNQSYTPNGPKSIYLQDIQSINLSGVHCVNCSVWLYSLSGGFIPANQNHNKRSNVTLSMSNCDFSSTCINIFAAEQAILKLNVTLFNCTIYGGPPYYSMLSIDVDGNKSQLVVDISQSNVSDSPDGEGVDINCESSHLSMIDICIQDSIFSNNDIVIVAGTLGTAYVSISRCQLLTTMVDFGSGAYTKAWMTIEDTWITSPPSHGHCVDFTLGYIDAVIRIKNCSISHCYNAGVNLEVDLNSSVDVSIQDSEIVHCSVGIGSFLIGDDWSLNLTIIRSNISQNKMGGMQLMPNAATTMTFQMELIIENCTFQRNVGSSLQMDSTNVSNRIILSMKRVHFVKNTVLSQEVPTVQVTGFINVSLDDCLFIDNHGTPIELSYGNLFVSGNTTFANNTGFQGGALSLIYSQVYLTENTIVTFQNNFAIDVGGAMYMVLTPQSPKRMQCFYQVLNSNNVTSLQILLRFRNNKANRGGDQIYGAALHDNCVMDEYSSKSVDEFEKFFHFDQGASNLSRISSDAERVCLCDSNGKPMCTSIDYILTIPEDRFPGEVFNISAVVVGYEFGTLSSTVFASLFSVNSDPSPTLGALQNSQSVFYNQCNDLTYSVHSRNTSSVVLVLKVTQAATETYGNNESIIDAILAYKQTKVIPVSLLNTPVFIKIGMLECPLGFEIGGDPPTCGCNALLKVNDITNCIIQDHEPRIYRSDTQWVGMFSIKNETEMIATSYCPLDYCKPVMLPISLNDSDKQCANERSGILCGACRENFSQIFGSSICEPCSDNNHLALLAAFAISGFALVFFVKLLDFTVAMGAMNGLIFYANIVWANKNIVLSTEDYSPVLNQILKTFLAWLNLDLGINTCFYVGLDAYWKTWLQYIFPVYIWTIAGLMILLSHYSIRASRIFGNNSVPVLATLFLLSYSKLLRVIITSLSFTYLQYSDGHITVWTEDGTVTFFGLAHTILFTVALLCLAFVWAPFMLTLLFIQPLRKVAHIWPLSMEYYLFQKGHSNNSGDNLIEWR